MKIKHVFLKTGHVESSAVSYLYLFHEEGFDTDFQVAESLYAVFCSMLPPPVECKNAKFHGAYCQFCGKAATEHVASLWRSPEEEDIENEVLNFATGDADSTHGVYSALEEAGWSPFLQLNRLVTGDGRAIHVEEAGEKFIASKGYA